MLVLVLVLEIVVLGVGKFGFVVLEYWFVVTLLLTTELEARVAFVAVEIVVVVVDVEGKVDNGVVLSGVVVPANKQKGLPKISPHVSPSLQGFGLHTSSTTEISYTNY